MNNYLSLLNENLLNQVLIYLDFNNLQKVIKNYKFYIDYLDLIKFRYPKIYRVIIKLGDLFNVEFISFYKFLLQIYYNDRTFKEWIEHTLSTNDIISNEYEINCINMINLIYIYENKNYLLKYNFPDYLLKWECIKTLSFENEEKYINELINIDKDLLVYRLDQLFSDEISKYDKAIFLFILFEELNWNIPDKLLTFILHIRQQFIVNKIEEGLEFEYIYIYRIIEIIGSKLNILRILYY